MVYRHGRMSLTVFISHCMSVEDEPIVREIGLRLTRKGLTAYLAERDLQPGRPLSEKILARIEESDLVAVVWTRAGASSTYVNQEIGAAKAAGKLVVPIVEKGVRPGAMLEGIERVEFERDKPETALESLESYLVGIEQRKEAREAEQRNAEFWSNVALVAGAIVIIVGVVLVVYAVAKRAA